MGLLEVRLVLVPLTFFCVLRHMFVSKSVQQGYSKPRPIYHKNGLGPDFFFGAVRLAPSACWPKDVLLKAVA